MKVLITDDALDTGGKERQILTSLRLFHDDPSVHMHLALLRESGVMGDRAFDYADDVMVCGRRNPISIKTVRMLKEYIRKHGIELIHCNGVIDAFHVFLATFDLDLKRVCTIHGYEKGKHLLVHKHVLSRFDAVIAVSESFLKDIKKDGYRARCFRVIPNSYSIDFIDFIDLQRQDSELLKLVMVSRFDWSKDHITILESMKMLKERGYHVHLDLIGSGKTEYTDSAKKWIVQLDLEEMVSLKGSVEVTPELLFGYDVMVMSSIAESFGIAIVEGMVTGLPVVVSDIPPFREITDNGKYGLLFGTGDPEDLSSKIEQLYESRDLRDQLASLARQRADYYSPEAFSNRTMALYRDVLGDATGADLDDSQS